MRSKLPDVCAHFACASQTVESGPGTISSTLIRSSRPISGTYVSRNLDPLRPVITASARSGLDRSRTQRYRRELASYSGNRKPYSLPDQQMHGHN